MKKKGQRNQLEILELNLLAKLQAVFVAKYINCFFHLLVECLVQLLAYKLLKAMVENAYKNHDVLTPFKEVIGPRTLRLVIPARCHQQ